MINQQQTLKRAVTCSGIGVHTGLTADMRICPAAPGFGIRFRRVDLSGGHTRDIPAQADLVTALTLATTIANETGDSVSTIEHLMAACAGLGLDNLLIEINNPEVPILDGSSAEFCELFEAAGIVSQGVQRTILRVLKPVEISDGQKWARLSPKAGDTLRLSARIEFSDAVIGTQEASFVVTPGTFMKDIAFARTFGFANEVAHLQSIGYARGGSLDNAIVVEDGRVLNEGGLHCPDEFVRHKLLDALGDLALGGAPIAGHYEAVRPGHALNNALLRKLLATRDAWCFETEQPDELLKSA